MFWKKKPKDRWLTAMESLTDGREPSELREHFLTAISKEFVRSRVIICPNVAVVSIADASMRVILDRAFEPEPVQREAARKRDEDIANVLTAVLKSDPKADLSIYEETLGINILKVELNPRPWIPQTA